MLGWGQSAHWRWRRESQLLGTRTVLYARVSTAEQSPENQILLAEKPGYAVIPERVSAETISGTVPAMERPGFVQVINKLYCSAKLPIKKRCTPGGEAEDAPSTW
jgi:putative DNA-invertase from lambdoid prophage Rac